MPSIYIPIPEVGPTKIDLDSLPPMKAERVCLVFPKSTFLIDPMVYPPLGLWYVWAECEKLGLDVAYRDLSVDKLPYDYDAYFISGTSPQAAEIRKVIAELKENAPDARILLGGSHAMTHDGQMLLHYGADVVVQCEGDLPGVIEEALRVPKGTVIKHPLTPKLEHIGRPVRKAAWRYHAYLSNWDGNPHATTTMFTSRGCPERCAFCIGEGQRVLMGDWTWKPIEQVEVGDWVLGFYEDDEAGIIAPTEVRAAVDNGIRVTVGVRAGGQTLRCTDDHRIYTEDKWLEAKNFGRVGQQMLRLVEPGGANYYNGLHVHTLEAYEEQRERRVYDLTTEAHTFIAEGFIVHNCETQGVWGRGVRWVPFETVKAEIEEIIDLGFTGIMFYDDIFPLNKKRTLQMLDVLKYHHTHNDLIWRCFLRTDVLAKQGGFDYLRLMREAGLREVLAGVESASNVIKNNIQKGTTIEQDTQALRWCKELGVAFKASTILGLPGETPETMLETLNWIVRERPDRADLNTYIPFPGTPITTAMVEGNNAYDIYLAKENMEDGEFPENYFYKGPRDSSVALVGTSHLTPAQIKAFRDMAVKVLDSEKIPY